MIHQSLAILLRRAADSHDLIGGNYAILLGPDFPQDAEIDGELRTHHVALWTCDDLVKLLRAHAVHAIRWPGMPHRRPEVKLPIRLASLFARVTMLPAYVRILFTFA